MLQLRHRHETLHTLVMAALNNKAKRFEKGPAFEQRLL